MTAPRAETLVTAITENYHAQCEAMMAADVDRLAQLLMPTFTLTHMTGYRQSRAQWLSDIATGQMNYHAIKNVSIAADTTDIETAVLTARSRTSATIWGAEGTWPLQLRIQFARSGGSWTAVDTVASTW